MHHVQFTLLPDASQNPLLERQRELSGWRVLDKLEGEFYGSFERKRERMLLALGQAERIKPLPVVQIQPDLTYLQAA